VRSSPQHSEGIMFQFDTKAINGAIDYTTPPMGAERKLTTIYVHVSAAPTGQDSFVVTLISAFGAEFNTVLYSIVLGAASTTDVFVSDIKAPLSPGDALKVTYDNDEHNTVAVVLTVE
jgi:hypothetical protein